MCERRGGERKGTGKLRINHRTRKARILKKDE
jgi:hypothetical protein